MTVQTGSLDAVTDRHWACSGFLTELKRALDDGDAGGASLIAFALTLAAQELLCAADDLAYECAQDLHTEARALRDKRQGVAWA